MGYPSVSLRYPVIVRRQLYKGTGNASRREICPWSVIGPGPVPTPIVGAVPVAVVKKNIYFNLRDSVHICPGYHDHWRRRWNQQRWWRRDSDRSKDTRLGNGSI